MATPIFDQLKQLIRDEQPVALATVVEGERRGAKLLVQPDESALGTLGNVDLDRVYVLKRDDGPDRDRGVHAYDFATDTCNTCKARLAVMRLRS